MSKTPLSDPIPVRIPLTILAEIEAIAETCERSRSWVIVRALRTYLASEGADILAVRQGRKDVADGNVHELDDVLRELEEIANGQAA